MAPLLNGDPTMIGSYRLVGRLGAGGMGQVFLGETASGRKVAVKIVHTQHVDDPNFRARFAREVEAARRVSGFYTAPVLDADPDADSPWMATAFVPGPSLHALVNERGPLPSGEVRRLCAGLAEGLAAVHAAGLVHRDLKPANIIVADDGPRIIDFGIARALDASTMTATGAIVGTLTYMSPEQLSLGDITPASDIFSLGSVLAYAATGHGPFDAPSPGAIVHRIMTQPPDLTGLPPDLTTLVTRCLAKDARQRPTPAQLLEGLGARAPQPAPMPPPAPGPRFPAPPTPEPPVPPTTIAKPARKVSRRTVLTGLVGGGVAATGAAVGGWLWLRPYDPLSGLGSTDVRSLAFSPDGRILVGGSWVDGNDDSLVFWDAVKGKVLSAHKAVPKGVSSVAFTPRGDRVVLAGADGTVRLWSVADRREIAVLHGHKEKVNAVAVSRTGVIASGGADGTIRFWDAGGRELRKVELESQGLPAESYELSFSPDGAMCASVGAYRGVRLWNPATGGNLAEIGQVTASSVAFSPDGGKVAVGQYGNTKGNQTVLVDPQARREVGAVGGGASVSALAFAPSGTTLVTSEDGPIRLSNATTQATLRELDPPATALALAVSPDGRTLASGGYGEVSLWRELGRL